MASPFLYSDFGSFLRRHFPFKVQKISLDAGFSCPNRSGEKGRGGCTYCNNRVFNPEYCRTAEGITGQLEKGKAFFSRKYPAMKYLAYFQSYTNTYGPPAVLAEKYEEALAVPGVVGLVVSTRPDCLPQELVDYLGRLSRRVFLLVELGIESTSDATLRRVNRGHTFAETADAVRRLAAAGVLTGGHVIFGLPGEGHEELMRQAGVLSALPLSILKIHQLQLVEGTRMAAEYLERPDDFHLFAVDEYIEWVIDYMERLRPDLVLERFVSQSPRGLLLAPRWGLKNHEFTERLRQRMLQRGSRQGRLYGQ